MKKPKSNGSAQQRVAMVGYKKTIAPQSEQKPKTNKKSLIIILASAVLAVALILGILFSLFGGGGFDYMKSDLGEYIALSEADYKDYTLEIKFDTVTDKDVDRKIMNLLYRNKAEEASNKGAEVFDVPVSIGDTVKIYYRGYTVDESGREHEVEGASNMLESYYSLGIGSTSFISGFEEGLIGAIPAEHRFTSDKNLIKEGEVLPDDVIYLSYSVMFPDGRTEKKSGERIDLKNPDVDKYYGEGFSEYFKSSNIIIGSKISKEQLFGYENGTAVYFDMTVNSVIRCEDEPFTVEATFPAHYKEKSLRGKTVNFDVYFKASVVYDTPDYDENFITETLKLTAEDLEKYKGDTLLDKHRAYLFEEAVAENGKIRETLIEEAVWEHYNDAVDVKSLPQSEVKSVYEELYAEIYTEYSTYYSSVYQSFDAYVLARYSADGKASPRALIENEAESIVLEKLIFYYIIREENLIPSEADFKKSYENAVKEHLDYYLSDIYAEELSKITNESEKQKRILEIKTEMMDYFGEDYFRELVYYDHAYEKIISFAKITDKK